MPRFVPFGASLNHSAPKSATPVTHAVEKSVKNSRQFKGLVKTKDGSSTNASIPGQKLNLLFITFGYFGGLPTETFQIKQKD